MDFAIEAGSFLLRWLHVVAAIAWIGESFYFVMLDRGLKKPASGAAGVAGEMWSVHGGGFYHKQKYLLAPAQMPEDLHWSKWKSYATWLSGFALLLVMYLREPGIYLIDPAVAALDPQLAAALVIGLLIGGWLIYDLLCRLVGFRDQLLGILVGLLVLALCWTTTQLFAGRAAFLLVGAILATIMSANVFFVIIPGQQRMVAALARGETPDPLPGQRGKQRSVHNTYFTLPVVFAMLSNHYGVSYAHPHNWLILALFMLAGALIRQFFVLWHSGGRAWWLLAAGGAVLIGTLAWLAPQPRAPKPLATVSDTVAADSLADHPVLQLAQPSSADILPLIQRHCSNCHAAQPGLMASAPQGLMFDRADQLEQHAARIHQQTVQLRIMPPGNLTGMSDAERAALDRWYQTLRAN
jgi:uncharacterized membrane protein